MPLCIYCKSIPFRDLFKGCRPLPTTASSQADTPKFQHRSHESIARLEYSAETCEFCRIVTGALKSSFWYHNMITEEDRNTPVWLHLAIGIYSPACYIYLGHEQPETKVFGSDIEMYPPIKGPLAEFCKCRYVYEDPLCESALNQIDIWIECCRHEHGQGCGVAREKTDLPTRVIDLSALPSRDAMLANKSWSQLFHGRECKLVENQTTKLGHYVSLSYCWGLSTAFKTTKSTLESRLAGFDFALLPKSLQDAIMITRFLGIQYIWIDCLCILQDDLDDWHREASIMGDIYSKSYLTIAAARSADSQNGFLGPRETKMTNLLSLEDEEGSFQLGFRTYDVSAAPGSLGTAMMEPLMAEPLTTRAWTLQERLLTPRSLHFGKEQMYWECSQLSLCEDGDTFGAASEDFRLQDIISGLQAPYQRIPDRWRWYKLLEAYTSRSMTKESDKLPALSGIAGAIQRQTNDTYYAGIWKKNFVADLLWRLEDPDFDMCEHGPRYPKRPGAWRAPSWSWASADGIVRYQEIAYEGQPCAELEECSVTPSGENPLGGVQDGFAQIRAPLTQIRNIASERKAGGFTCDIQLEGSSFKTAKLFFDFERRDSCSALMLTPNGGLAIVQAEGVQEAYVRVGVVQLLKGHDEPWIKVSPYPEVKSIRLL